MMSECKIVEDLLPLYAEDLVSPESKVFLEEHCRGCENCEKLRRQCLTPLPVTPPDPVQYKKSLRRDSIRMVLKGTAAAFLAALIFVGIVGLGAWYIAWETGQYPLEVEYESVVVDEKYGVITTSVKIADWDTAGFRNTGAGSIIIQENSVRNGSGYSGSMGSGGRAWENVEIFWAPNGMDYLISADLVEGGHGYFVVDNTYSEDEHGGSHYIQDWYPGTTGKGMTQIISDLLAGRTEIPAGWKSIEFTFYRWGEDNETIAFIFETDTGRRGLLDFHYPSETITKID